MPEDPYQVLGVARDADGDAIRRAYRALAKKHHPDLNPGDATAEARFKGISQANMLLSDPEMRARFDRGEIDGAGQQSAPDPRYRDYAESAAGSQYGRADQPASGRPAGGWTRAEWGDIFGDMFGGHANSGAGQSGPDGQSGPLPGRDARYTLTVAFLDAVNGAVRRLTMPDGNTLDVTVPAGIEGGQVLRLRGKGGAGWNGGPAGDALIEIHVSPHPFFRREGNDIHLDVKVTLREAVLGAKITVPTPSGPVSMTIPARAESGRRLRLRGRGVPVATKGDLHVTLRIAATEADDALAAFMRDWTPANPVHPRDDAGVPS